MRSPQVVIVGAGFAGLWAFRTLARSRASISLLDRNNYHTFQPLLYQVGAAELEPENIAYPIRSILRKFSNAGFILGEVKAVDFTRRVVQIADSEIPYDFLILAAGSVTHFFGVPGAADLAFPLKALEHGVALRNHTLSCFERAMQEPDAQRRRQALTFAIVGGGPTGVEFAGTLAELIRGPLAKDYPNLDFREVKVLLLEALGRLLSDMPECCGAYAVERLRRMNVDVCLNAIVTRVTPEALHLKDGMIIPTETVVWTAGVRGDPLAERLGLPTGRNGRVAVLPTLQTPGHPEVYVIGDLCHLEQDGRPLPMTAPVAIQQGVTAAQNIMRQMAGQPPAPFRFRDKGTMVTIGRNVAVAHLARRCFTGFVAWLIWLAVHIFNLIGFRNRLLVLMNWAWDYLLYERTVRLILPSESAATSQADAPNPKTAIPLDGRGAVGDNVTKE